MSNSNEYVRYIAVSIFNRLTPLRPSTFAENTLNRFDREYGQTDEYAIDKAKPRNRSIYWRLVKAVQAERKYGEKAAALHSGGFFRVWRKTALRMLILALAVYAASTTVPWAIRFVLSLH